MSIAQENVTTKNSALAKWGVRLIGLCFFLWATSNLIDVVTVSGNTKGFYGITMTLSDDIDITAWIGIYILFYTGVQLMRFDKRGRIWALILHWPLVIVLGVLFIASIILLFMPSFYESLPFSFAPKVRFLQIVAETPLETSLFFLLDFVYFAAPLYFLLRKDTKALFNIPATTGETH